MKNNYIKNFLKVIIWPIIFMIGSFLINYIFVAIFNSKEINKMSNNEFIDYIKTVEYQNKLNNFINSKALLIVFITFVIFFPVFYNVYKKYIVKDSFKIKSIYVPILFGISISLIYNIILFNLNKIFNFTDLFTEKGLPLIVQVISSGLIGPILEELLFRGIVYNKLKEFNKPMTAIILTSILFCIVHANILDAIYAFGVSFIFIFLYEKYKTIKVPIIMHIALNMTIILLFNVINRDIILLNCCFVCLGVVALLFLRKIIIKTV